MSTRDPVIGDFALCPPAIIAIAAILFTIWSEDVAFNAPMTDRAQGWVIAIVASAVGWSGILWLAGAAVRTLSAG